MKTIDAAWKVANQFGDLAQCADMLAGVLNTLITTNTTVDDNRTVIEMALKRYREVNEEMNYNDPAA